MRIFSLGNDPTLYNEQSAVRARQIAYSELFDHTDIIMLVPAPAHAPADQAFSSSTQWHQHNLSKKSTLHIPRHTPHQKNHTLAKIQLALDAGRYATQLIRTVSRERTPEHMGQPRILTAQDPFFIGLLGVYIGWRTGTALHVQVHTDAFSKDFANFSLQNRFRQWLACFVLRRARAVRVVSQKIADDIIRRGLAAKEAITILPIITASIPSAPAPAAAPTATLPPSPSLLFVGRLEKEKNPHTIIEIVAALKAAGKPLPADIIGDGSCMPALKALAAARGVAHLITFHGHVNDPTPWYQSPRILIVPSAYEGFGMVLLEAARAGLSIVSRPVGIAKEIGATIVPSAPRGQKKDTHHWIQAITTLIQQPRAPHYTIPGYIVNDAQVYATQYRHSFVQALPALFICTQAVDDTDSALAFFIDWLAELAKHYPALHVLCLRTNAPAAAAANGSVREPRQHHLLPAHVHIYKLPAGSLRRALATIAWSWRLRRQYQTVFVHMIIETAVIAGGIWKALGKRIVIWYSHRAVSWRLRTAAARADALVTTSPHGCNVYPAKRHSIGHGINTERLMVTGHLVSTVLASAQHTTAALQPITLTHIGRITPIKKCEVLLDAAALLHGQGLRNVRVIFAGEPYTAADHAYKKKLQERITMLVTTHGLPHFAAAIEWRGRIAHSALPALFAESMYTVNMAPAGGMDKTVIESWIAGIPALVSNPAFTEAYTGALGSPSAAAAFMFREGDAHSLAEHINQALVARRHTYPKIGSADMRPAFMHRAQKYFIEYFGVEAFIQRLVHILR